MPIRALSITSCIKVSHSVTTNGEDDETFELLQLNPNGMVPAFCDFSS